MGRHIVYSEAVNRRLREEGRGKGEGADYVPWLLCDDFPSKGRSHRIPDPYNHRIHHFFSDLEARYYYYLCWSKRILDVREQYPLSPERTLAIADRLGVKHPRNKDGSLFVMTTDFLLTVHTEDDNEKYLARSVKRREDIMSDNKRLKEKLQIEATYWISLGVEWKIVTEESFSRTMADNAKHLLSRYNDPLPPNHEEMRIILFRQMSQQKSNTLANVCTEVDDLLEQDPGTALRFVFYLAAHRELTFDMNTPIRASNLIKNIIDTSLIDNYLRREGELNATSG